MRGLKVLLLGLISVAFMAGLATANTTVVFPDNTITWPGYTNPLGWSSEQDEYGLPKIDSMAVTRSDSGYLESVMLQMKPESGVYSRVYYDSLFINAGGSAQPLGYESWDYYVYQDFDRHNGVPMAPEMFEVTGAYTYRMGTFRYWQPAGLAITGKAGWTGDDGLTPNSGLLQSVTWNDTNGQLTYLFTPGEILLDAGWVIGYTENCANDVILTPEPGSLLLLGLGLIGVGFTVRRRHSK